MPYIARSQKEKVDKGLIALNLSELKDAGSLNYAVHKLIAQYFSQNEQDYQSFNDVIGVLDCAKMEIYRRLIAEYEEKKILQNGDVEPYSK